MAAILSTSFAVAVTDWAATWPLASVTGVQIGHLCAAESELAQVTRVGPASTVTVRRGVEGTAAAAHAASTPVAVYRAGDVDTTPVPPESLAAVSLRQATVTLTDAQVKALPTTFVPILAAPGGTRILVPVLATLRLDQRLDPSGYTNIAATNASFGLRTGDASTNCLPLVLLKNDTTSGTNQVTRFLSFNTEAVSYSVVPLSFESYAFGGSYQIALADTKIENRALTMFAANAAAGNYTGGHAANTLTVSVLYSILDVTTGIWV